MANPEPTPNIFELKPRKDTKAAQRARRYRLRKRDADAAAERALTVSCVLEKVTPATSRPPMWPTTESVTPSVTQTVTPSVTPRVEVLPLPQGNSRLGAVLVAVAFSAAALGVGINVQTGIGFGNTQASAVTFAGLSVAADILAITLPSVAVALWARSSRALASAAWGMWIMTLGLAALASVGYVNLHVSDTAARRAATISTAAAVTTQRDASIAAAQQAATAATTSRQAECQIRGARCRALEQVEQQRLGQLSAALAMPIPAAAKVADADPQLAGALRLANCIGLKVTAIDLGNLRLALMALLTNLAGVVLCFGLALRRSEMPHLAFLPGQYASRK